MAGLERIRGQERPRLVLERTLASGRLAQSYLFAGPAGVGKELAAFEVAKAVNCLDEGRDGPGACGVCASCRKIDAFRHPDVSYTFPVPSQTKPEEIGELLRDRAGHPGRIISFDKNVSISIDAVRRLKDDSAYRVYEGKYKVAVIRDADMMNVHAANALLKLLEEPPERMLLFLTTSRVQALLPTILSRCQRIRFGFLDEDTVAGILRDLHGTGPDDAALAARLSGGTVRGALEMLDDDLGTVRDSAADLFACVRSGDALQAFAVIEPLTRGRNTGLLERLLRMLAGYYRDMLMLKTGRSGRVANTARLAELEAAAAETDVSGVAAAGETVERYLGMLGANVSPLLILANLVQELRSVTAGGRA